MAELITTIIVEITNELIEAEKKFPRWSDDILHALAILQEEVGEMTKECVDYHYGRGDISKVRSEAIQAGAMIFRFLLGLDGYKTEIKNE